MYIYMYVCVYMYIYTCVYICTYICTCVYICTYIHVCIYVHIYVCVYMYIYYVCIYMRGYKLAVLNCCYVIVIFMIVHPRISLCCVMCLWINAPVGRSLRQAWEMTHQMEVSIAWVKSSLGLLLSSRCSLFWTLCHAPSSVSWWVWQLES